MPYSPHHWRTLLTVLTYAYATPTPWHVCGCTPFLIMLVPTPRVCLHPTTSMLVPTARRLAHTLSMPAPTVNMLALTVSVLAYLP